MHDVLTRRWPFAVLTALLLGACEPIPSSGQPWKPAAVTEEAPEVAPAPEPRAAPEALAVAEPADAELPPAEVVDPFAPEAPIEAAPPAAEPDALALQAMLLGKPAPPPPPPVVAPEPAPAAEAPVPVWDPERPLPEATFGVRVLSTLSHLQPPRAVLGLPDGAETVVQAGTILPEQHVIVMAIGRDVVQLARVVPEGYFARIETQNVTALFPTERGETAR